MKKLVFALMVLVVLVVVGKNLMAGRPPLQLSSGELRNPYPVGSALYAQQQEFVDRFNADPRLRDRFAGVFSRKGLYAEIETAMARGARSLDARSLVQATRAMARVIPRLPPRSCAKLMRPRDDFDPELGADIRAALEALPPAHHRNLWDFYLKALVAEVEDAPTVRMDPAARERALQDLGNRYPGRFGERLAGVLRDRAGASDEDACWAINSMIHTSTQLGPENAEAMSRLIWGGH